MSSTKNIISDLLKQIQNLNTEDLNDLSHTFLAQIDNDQLAVLNEQLQTRLKSVWQNQLNQFLEQLASDMIEHEFTLSDVVMGLPAVYNSKKFNNAMYVDPDNAALTWSGLGRRPLWFNERLNQGYSKESMLQLGKDSAE